MKKPQRKPGRPALAPGQTPGIVQVRLPPQVYDKADQIAKRDGVSLPEVLRRGLARVFRDE